LPTPPAPPPQGVVRPRPPAVPPAAHSLGPPAPFLLLPDPLLLRVLHHLDTAALVRVGLTCRRLRHLCWEPSLWAAISLQGDRLPGDAALASLLGSLARAGGRGVVRRLEVLGCPGLSDLGLAEVARHCPHLETLDIRGCREVTDAGVTEVVARCPQLSHLNLAGRPPAPALTARPGCSPVAGLSPGRPTRERLARGLALTRLDLSDCPRSEAGSARQC
jgi:hypothetical protein